MSMLADAFFNAWLVMTILTTGGIGLLGIWCLRNGQFSRQKRARFLPLLAEVPEDDAPGQAPVEPAGKAVKERDTGDDAQ